MVLNREQVWESKGGRWDIWRGRRNQGSMGRLLTWGCHGFNGVFESEVFDSVTQSKLFRSVSSTSSHTVGAGSYKHMSSDGWS